VGTLRSGLTFPWFDGWHVTGTIVVDETLYGQRPAGQIKFRFVCDCMCQYWPPPRYSLHFTEKGLWFLRPVMGKHGNLRTAVTVDFGPFSSVETSRPTYASISTDLG
jgi:hypothetical protein